MRERLQRALHEPVPVKGIPVLAATSVVSTLADVLRGLLIADSTDPAEELDLPVTSSG